MPDSWWLKFKRAQQHMIEIRRYANAYAQRHPYEIVRIAQPHRKHNRRREPWRYKLVFEPTDPMLAMVLGDFIHNLRTALDHIVVACSPPGYRKNASFPVRDRDIFARNDNGEFLDPDAKGREDFRSAVRGLGDSEALTVVIAAQPYQRDPRTDIIGVLSRLENADKHRQLITLGAGLRGGNI
jgi:hypothetical protein